MASTQTTKEERAGEAAKVAASEFEYVNRTRREQEDEGRAQHEQGQEQKGVLGSLLKSARETYEHAKEAVTGKTHETTEKTKESADVDLEKAKEAKDKAVSKAGETKEASAEKARETKEPDAEKAKRMEDSASQKASEAAEKAGETNERAKEKVSEYKDYTAEKTKEAKEATKEKADEYKDYTTEKAKEGKDATVNKAAELKVSVVEAAKKTMDFLTGKKEETKQKTDETGEAAKEKFKETGEEARRKMEELKLKEEGHTDEDSRCPEADRETAADRGNALRGNIFSSIGNVVGAIEDKLTHPTDAMEEKRSEAPVLVGGTKERFVVDVTETPAGSTAEVIKSADDEEACVERTVGGGKKY